MTRPQHEAARALGHAEAEFLRAYHWTQEPRGRWAHPKAPRIRASFPGYEQSDALALTRADTLRFGSGS